MRLAEVPACGRNSLLRASLELEQWNVNASEQVDSGGVVHEGEERVHGDRV